MRAIPAVSGRRVWTKDFTVMTTVNVLVSMNFYLLMIVMTKFATERFHASTALAGFTVTIFVIGNLVVRPFIGRWIAHVGQKRMLYAGLSLILVLTLLYYLAGSIGTLLVVRFFHGAAFGTTTISTGTVVAGVVDRRHFGRGMAYFTLGQTIATAIGPFLGLLLIQRGSFESIIAACAAVSVIALGMLALVSAKDVRLTDEQRAETRGFKLSNYAELKVAPLSLAVALGYLCYTSVVSFLALYSQQVRLTAAAGYFFLVFAATVIVTRPLVGRLFDGRGENSVMYPAIVSLTASLVVLSRASNAYLLLLSAALLGLGFGTIQSSGQTIAMKMVPPHRVGLANSTFFIFADIGVGLGPVLSGLLIPSLDYRGMYLSIAAVGVACLVLYYLLHGRRAAAALASHAHQRAG